MLFIPLMYFSYNIAIIYKYAQKPEKARFFSFESDARNWKCPYLLVQVWSWSKRYTSGQRIKRATNFALTALRTSCVEFLQKGKIHSESGIFSSFQDWFFKLSVQQASRKQGGRQDNEWRRQQGVQGIGGLTMNNQTVKKTGLFPPSLFQLFQFTNILWGII